MAEIPPAWMMRSPFNFFEVWMLSGNTRRKMHQDEVNLWAYLGVSIFNADLEIWQSYPVAQH